MKYTSHDDLHFFVGYIITFFLLVFFTDLSDSLKMGLLTLGHPLSWEETKKHAQSIREHGIEQFIQIYKKVKDRRNDCLKWGDEVRRKKIFSFEK